MSMYDRDNPNHERIAENRRAGLYDAKPTPRAISITAAMFHFGHTAIHCVPAGTVVKRDGRMATVTDENAVQADDRVYVTQKIYDQIKAQSSPA